MTDQPRWLLDVDAEHSCSQPITEADLKELEELCEKAKNDTSAQQQHIMIHDPYLTNFVTASRTAIPKLIAEIRRLRDGR